MIIGVIGGRVCSIEEAELAENVGRELARRGATVVCGGLSGIMEAVCKGALSAGGMTIGILPGDDRNAANPYVRIPIVTGIGLARNMVVVKSAEALIAIHGWYGTLSEIAYALHYGTPVIGLNTWCLSRNGESDNSIILAFDAKDAVDKAFYAVEKGAGRVDNYGHDTVNNR